MWGLYKGSQSMPDHINSKSLANLHRTLPLVPRHRATASKALTELARIGRPKYPLIMGRKSAEAGGPDEALPSLQGRAIW